MAAKLNDMLEPGERILYRDPRRWVPGSWHADLATLAMVICCSIAFDLGPFGPIFFLVLYSLSWLGQVIDALTCWAAVTDRRILQKSGWRAARIDDIPLADVVQVTFLPSSHPGTLGIQTRDGGETDLEHLNDPQSFATAAAGAVGLKRPTLIGGLMNTMPYIGLFGGMLFGCLILFGYFHLTWFVLAEGVVPEGTILYWLLIVLIVPFALLLLYLGIRIGFHLASLVGLGILRPFGTLEHAHNALHMGLWFDAGRPPSDRIVRLYHRWIGLLYGRTVNSEASAGAHHDG